MAGGHQRNPTTGGVKRNPDTGGILKNTETNSVCCCEEVPPDPLTCADCMGTPCGFCPAGLAPNAYTVTFSGVTSCTSCVNVFSSSFRVTGTLSGTFVVTGGACNYSYTVGTGGPVSATLYSSFPNCVGPNVTSDGLHIHLHFGPVANQVTLQVWIRDAGSATGQGLLFCGVTSLVGDPDPCCDSRVFANIFTGPCGAGVIPGCASGSTDLQFATGGTATVTVCADS